MANDFLFAGDCCFAILQACREEHLSEVYLGQFQRNSVLGFFAREAVAVFRSAPDCPAPADEGGRIEWLGAVDDERARPLDHEIQTVVQKGDEATINFFNRTTLYTFLDCVVINSIQLEIQDADGDVLRLTKSCSFHTHSRVRTLYHPLTQCARQALRTGGFHHRTEMPK